MTYWVAWAVLSIVNFAALSATAHNLRETKRLLAAVRDANATEGVPGE